MSVAFSRACPAQRLIIAETKARRERLGALQPGRVITLQNLRGGRSEAAALEGQYNTPQDVPITDVNSEIKHDENKTGVALEKQIVAGVCFALGITPEQLKTGDVGAARARYRAITAYMLRTFAQARGLPDLPLSYPCIAENLGQTDHTSALSACRRTQARMTVNGVEATEDWRETLKRIVAMTWQPQLNRPIKPKPLTRYAKHAICENDIARHLRANRSRDWICAEIGIRQAQFYRYAGKIRSLPWGPRNPKYMPDASA